MDSNATRNVLSAVLMAVALLPGCVAVDTPPLPITDVPDDWLVSGNAATAWPALDWWHNFHEPELNRLMEQVRENNLDLQNNRRNLESAQIALEEAGFALLPTPSLTIGSDITETNGDARGGSGNGEMTLRAALQYSDILSRRPAYDQALAEYESSRARVASTALNTLGTAASTYFRILLLRDRITAAQQNVQNAEEIGAITRARVDVGVAVPIDALQQQISIQQQRTSLEQLRQDELAARASLALLLGRSVQQFEVDGDSLEQITVPELQPGIPSGLLRRRPDLVDAEAALERAATGVELERLDFFPQISLTGSASSTSTSLTELLRAPDLMASMTLSLSQTLLDNGQRSRELDQSRLALQNRLNDYRSAVLQAFNDIDVLLNDIRVLQEEEQVAQENLAAAEESFRIARLRYEEGVVDYQTVLTTQDTLFSSRTAYLSSKIELLNAMVALYQALGGGWHAEDQDTMSIAGPL